MVNKTLDWLAKNKNKWWYYPFALIVLPLLLLVAIITYPIRWLFCNEKNSKI